MMVHSCFLRNFLNGVPVSCLSGLLSVLVFFVLPPQIYWPVTWKAEESLLGRTAGLGRLVNPNPWGCHCKRSLAPDGAPSLLTRFADAVSPGNHLRWIWSRAKRISTVALNFSHARWRPWIELESTVPNDPKSGPPIESVKEREIRNASGANTAAVVW